MLNGSFVGAPAHILILASSGACTLAHSRVHKERLLEVGMIGRERIELRGWRKLLVEVAPHIVMILIIHKLKHHLLILAILIVRKRR